MQKTVWYVYRSPNDWTVTVDTQGSNYDTVLVVYRDNGGLGRFEAFQRRACNDDVQPGTLWSKVVFTNTPGYNHYIQVGGFRRATGNLEIGIN